MKFLTALALMAATPALADVAAPEVRIEPTETGVSIEGIVVGLSDGTVRGELLIDKSGPGGTSKLKQGREILVSRGSRDTIGRTGLSMQPGAELSVTLTIYADDVEIATSTSRIKPPEHE